MIKFYSNRELSDRLAIRLSKWKRWSREFLPPDPLGGMQSGYARQYTLDQAFTVFLGGHLVADLHFSIPEARQIGQELAPWIHTHIPSFLGKTTEKSFENTTVYIFKQISLPDKGAAFTYLEKKQLFDEPYEVGDLHARQEVYIEKPIPVDAPTNGLDETVRMDKMDSRILYVSRLYDGFVMAIKKE